MFFPYKDDNPRILIPYVTYVIVALNVLIFLFQFGLPETARMELSLSYGLIPALLDGVSGEYIVEIYRQNLNISHFENIRLNAHPHHPVMTVFTSMFLHGGWMHLLGNMWFLWIFGDNVESTFGHVKFALFYLLCGIGAAAGQIIIDVSSVIPMIGASGAISGVLAAYMLRYPRARVHVFIFLFIFITTIRIPAFIVIGIWFLQQLSSGLASLGITEGGGVAWFAHIGGFIAGIVFERAFKFIRIIKR